MAGVKQLFARFSLSYFHPAQTPSHRTEGDTMSTFAFLATRVATARIWFQFFSVCSNDALAVKRDWPWLLYYKQTDWNLLQPFLVKGNAVTSRHSNLEAKYAFGLTELEKRPIVQSESTVVNEVKQGTFNWNPFAALQWQCRWRCRAFDSVNTTLADTCVGQNNSSWWVARAGNCTAQTEVGLPGGESVLTGPEGGDSVSWSGFTGGWNCETLQKLRTKLKNKRPGNLTDGAILMHDTASPHVAHRVQDKLNTKRWEVLKHPAYRNN
jgi:hypothetical protein